MSSQAGSSEVSKKLKAAIRAKLEELGVYVDDELPDYIMVMIANKKEKVHMKDDLSLFIGKSTAKFVDWLFDLFDRLQSASSSKPGEPSKKEEEVKKEAEQKEKEQEDRHREEKHRKEEKEREMQKEKEKERDREKERQRERDREKRQEEEKRREEKKREAQKSRRRTRSRSNTYSDEEANIRTRGKERRPRDHRGRSAERRRSIGRHPSKSPEPQKVQSTVMVKRKIRATGDTNIRGRGTMFLRAMNEASVSAGYKRPSESNHENNEEDDMSDVDALPSKSKLTPSPKKSIRERMSRIPKAADDEDSVVLNNQPQTGGPQMIVKLSGGKEAIKRTRIQDRIVVDDSLRRGLLKRKIEASEEPKSKHERIIFDINASRDSTPTDDSPTMQPWNGQIKIDDDSSDSFDDEAEIDAFLSQQRRESVREEEEELPPTHQLSGKTFAVHVNQHYQQQAVPAYIPTPLSVLQEQQNQMGAVKEDNFVKERCIFWPKCTKGDACAFMHPAKNCTNFPNCSYGIRCLFIHPPCRFDRFCTKKHCPFTHYGTGGVQPGQAPPTSAEMPISSNRAPAAPLDTLPKPATRGALGSLAEKLAASLKKKVVEKKEEKSDENETKADPESPTEKTEDEKAVKTLPEIPPLTNMIPCRYAGGCRNPACHFKHPKECRFGANCRNPSCYFYHKPAPKTTAPPVISADGAATTTAKYKWTATTSQ